MGLKPRSGGDDFANTVVALTTEFPQVAAFIAGHTHQTIPSRITNGVLLTQAIISAFTSDGSISHSTALRKKLLRREARCERMNNRVGLDHVVHFTCQTASRRNPLVSWPNQSVLWRKRSTCAVVQVNRAMSKR